jgi:hypothetical protein
MSVLAMTVIALAAGAALAALAVLIARAGTARVYDALDRGRPCAANRRRGTRDRSDTGSSATFPNEEEGLASRPLHRGPVS